LAASKAQKDKAARLLAHGKSEAETATAVGVSRSTVQSWKRKPDFNQLIDNNRAVVAVASAEFEQKTEATNNLILGNIAALAADEGEILKRWWALFNRLEKFTNQVLDNSEPEDISPRQIPKLVKALGDSLQLGLTLNDRISGAEVLLDAYNRIEQARSQE